MSYSQRSHRKQPKPDASESSSMQSWRFPLASDVRQLLEKQQVDLDGLNASLWLDRYAEWSLKEGKLEVKPETSKRQQVLHLFGRDPSAKTRRITELHTRYKDRWIKLLTSLHSQGYVVQRFEMRAASRVIVGLGAESILETNICLHCIYGFPILPGSALKGLARTYGLFQIAEKLGVPPLPLDVCNERKANKIPTPLEKLEQYLLSEEDKDKNHWLEQLKKDDAVAVDAPLQQMNLKQMDETELNGKGIRVKDWRLIFGAMGQKGKVIFFDAIPGDLADLTLDLDVMNPHYAPYYQGNEPPADYHNPIPIFFLTIGAGSEFSFAVASRDESLAKAAKTWLTGGLKHLGIGAKTVAGYGYWMDEEEQGKATGQETQAVHETPPYLEKTPKQGEQVYAKVLDNSRKPIRVCLLVKGYEDTPIECAGVGNLASCPPGIYIKVKVTQMKGQQITQVSLQGIWKP